MRGKHCYCFACNHEAMLIEADEHLSLGDEGWKDYERAVRLIDYVTVGCLPGKCYHTCEKEDE